MGEGEGASSCRVCTVKAKTGSRIGRIELGGGVLGNFSIQWGHDEDPHKVQSDCTYEAVIIRGGGGAAREWAS